MSSVDEASESNSVPAIFSTSQKRKDKIKYFTGSNCFFENVLKSKLETKIYAVRVKILFFCAAMRVTGLCQNIFKNIQGGH